MKHLNHYINIRKGKSTIKATDETIKQIVKDALDLLGHDTDLNYIDVSEVTNMDSLFSCYKDDLGPKYKDLNPDISKWNVSNVENMRMLFYECNKFNQDLSMWNVSKVDNMIYLFCECKNFNQDLSTWDVGNVKNMYGMFEECRKFNQDLSEWDVSNVKQIQFMFCGCENFNQDLSKWDVSNVRYHDNMFKNCPIKEEFKPKFRK